MPATALPFVRSEQSNSLDRGAAIYGAPWIPSIYHQSMLALIYQHHGSVMGYSIHLSGRITCVTFVMYSSHLSQPVLMFPWLEFVLSWSIPLHPMVLLIIIPFLNGYNWEYTLFSDKPILIACFCLCTLLTRKVIHSIRSWQFQAWQGQIPRAWLLYGCQAAACYKKYVRLAVSIGLATGSWRHSNFQG